MAEVSTPSSKCIGNEVYRDPFFEFRSSTKTKVVKLRHTWTINNFWFCCEETGKKLISPTFSARKNQWNDKSEWRLELYPNGRNKDSSNYVSLFIRLITPNLNIIQTEYKLGVVSAKGINICEHNDSIKLGKKVSECGNDKFMYKALLLNKRNIYLSGDNLTVYCDITATIGIENISETLTTSESDLSKLLHVSKYYENDYVDPIFKSTSSTLIKIVKIRYSWTINNFGSRSEENGEELISPTFSAGENRWNDKSEWCLSLYPKGMDKESSEYVSLFIERNTCRESEIQIQYKLSIVNADGEFMENFEDSDRFNKNINDIGETEFIRRNDLDNQENKYIVDGKLTIFCDITATACSDNTSEILNKPKSNLTNGFAFLFGNSELSDVTLSAGGKEFPAHKVVLAVQSPVFRVMFQNDMEESRKNRVDINDLDEEGLSEMLRYMYTGEVHKLNQMAPRLLGMAEKYAMDGLKIKCEKALFESLSLGNAAEIFILSDTFHTTKLKEQVKDFIVAHASDIGKTPGFESMIRTHPHLGVEAFCVLSNSSVV